MTNADLQTIGICLQALFTGLLVVFACRGLSAWKAQSRAGYRLEVLRSLSRTAFRLVAHVHDARAKVLRPSRPEDVIDWTPEQKRSVAPALRHAADLVSQTNDELLQTLVEARGAWGDDAKLQRLGKALALKVRALHSAFRALVVMLGRRDPAAVFSDAEKRKAIVRICLSKGEPEPTPETEELMSSFHAFLDQIATEFRETQK